MHSEWYAQSINTLRLMCRRAKQQQEWEERQAERKARQAEMAGEPFDKEVNLQLECILASFVTHS